METLDDTVRVYCPFYYTSSLNLCCITIHNIFFFFIRVKGTREKWNVNKKNFMFLCILIIRCRFYKIKYFFS